MLLLKSLDGTTVSQYPYTVSDFRAEFPNVSIPRNPTDAQLAEFNIYKVTETAKPAKTTSTDPVEQTPQWTGTEWIQVWGSQPVSAEEQATREAIEREIAEREAIKLDTFVGNFIAMTPQQVEAYIDANVTDLNSAKNVMSKMAVMLLLLARREFK